VDECHFFLHLGIDDSRFGLHLSLDEVNVGYIEILNFKKSISKIIIEIKIKYFIKNARLLLIRFSCLLPSYNQGSHEHFYLNEIYTKKVH